MKIGKDNNQFDYKLQNQRLQIVAEEKDIGVIIDDQLNFESHMSTKIERLCLQQVAFLTPPPNYVSNS